jgi:hypothetical protein
MTSASGCSEAADPGFSRPSVGPTDSLPRELSNGKSIQIKSLYSVRKAVMGSTLAARPAGKALAARATTATPVTARR